jgi:hypothetical protein
LRRPIYDDVNYLPLFSTSQTKTVKIRRCSKRFTIGSNPPGSAFNETLNFSPFDFITGEKIEIVGAMVIEVEKA